MVDPFPGTGPGVCQDINVMAAHFLCRTEASYDNGRTAFSRVKRGDDVKNVHSSSFKVGTSGNRLPSTV